MFCCQKKTADAPKFQLERCFVEDGARGESSGFGYVAYPNADDGKKAIEQLNGFELANKSIKVASVENEPQQPTHSKEGQLGQEDRSLQGSGRLQLMAKLAEGAFRVLKQ